MYLDRKPLAFSQLASSKADVYKAPYATKGFVQNVMLHNAGASAETVTLYYDDGTSEHQWLSQSVAAKDSFVLALPGEGFVVEPGAKIAGSADTAATVTCKLSGTEESESRVAGVESNLWCPPATPHAMDDEFDGPVLSGWGCQNVTDDVAGTISYGAIDAYDPSFTTGDAVRVDMGQRRSWALLQPPSSNDSFFFYKSYTLPTNLLMWARMKFSVEIPVVNNDDSLSLQFMSDAGGGAPDTTYRITIFINEPDAGEVAAQAQYNTSGSALGIVETTNTSLQGQALEYAAIHKLGSTYHIWVGTNAGNWIWVTSYTVAFTPDMVGFSVKNNSVGGAGSSVHGIDFIRFIETDNFLL